MFRAFHVVSAVLLAGFLAAKPSPLTPDPLGPRPIDGPDTVFLEDMTWMEIRDAMNDGSDTVIVATGGIEQNGPYLVAGKHNIVLRATTEAIARKLGNALVAPIVGFVPEGDFDPPTEHMKYPSTVGVSEDTYQRLVTDICTSYHTHGFAHIVLIGDSGGNQKGLEEVAARLNTRWAGDKARVHYIPEYFNYTQLGEWLEQQGLHQEPEGLHDDFGITAIMMTVDPTSVRMKERIAAGKFHINGVNLAPASKTIKWGKRIVDYRADVTVKAIRKANAAARID